MAIADADVVKPELLTSNALLEDDTGINCVGAQPLKSNGKSRMQCLLSTPIQKESNTCTKYGAFWLCSFFH